MAGFRQIPALAWSGEFTKDGIDYGPIACEMLQCGLKKYLWQECFSLLLLDEAIRKVHPKSLLVLYDHGIFEACSVQLAKRHGVKTVTLQHGISNRDIPGYFPLTSDCIACWGEKERETLAAQGIPSERIIVTGYPAFDNMWQQSEEPKPGFINVDRKPTRVLIATQGVQASVEWRLALTPTARIIRALIKLGLPEEKYFLTFRLHPNEQLIPAMRAMAGQAGITITKGEPLDRQFAQTDVVVTQFSTIGFEALLADKALVSLNWASDDELIPFAKSGVAARSKCPEDFPGALEKAISLQSTGREARSAFLSTYLCGKGASARLMDLLL